MSDSSLSAPQLHVINALSEGVNSTTAAAQAGVHRNTIANWRRNYLPFREALAHAQYDRAIFFREQAEDRVDLAYQTLDALLQDPKTSPSVRLKAAIFIIEMATTPPPPKQQVPLDIEKIRISKAPPITVDTNGQILHNVHSPAQPAVPVVARKNPPDVHKTAQSAQMPIHRESPKVGRNEPCPCRSGKKFKYCCLDKVGKASAATSQEPIAA